MMNIAHYFKMKITTKKGTLLQVQMHRAG